MPRDIGANCADLWTDPGREATIAAVMRPAFRELPVPATIEQGERALVVDDRLEAARPCTPGSDGGTGARRVITRLRAQALGSELAA